MSRSIRMFEIIQILRVARRPMTAQSIAEELEVTRRTIYRDIVSLQAMRVPIDGEAGIGYVMRPGFDLPPLMFGDEEVEAIMVGLALIGRTGDESLQRAAVSVRRKIEEATHCPGSRHFRDPSLFTSKWHDIPEPAVDLRLLRQCVRDEVAISINYRSVVGEESQRTVLPLALVYYVDVQILAAWCELRQDYRHFRIDRINSCTLHGNSFSSKAQALRTTWSSLHQFGE